MRCETYRILTTLRYQDLLEIDHLLRYTHPGTCDEGTNDVEAANADECAFCCEAALELSR